MSNIIFTEISEVLSVNNFIRHGGAIVGDINRVKYIYPTICNGSKLGAIIEYGQSQEYGTVEFLTQTEWPNGPKKRWFMELYKGLDQLNEHITGAVVKFIKKDTKPASEELETFTKSKYLAYHYHSHSGMVYAIFPDPYGEIKVFDLLATNGVDISIFSFQHIETLVNENNDLFNAIYYNPGSKEFLMKADLIFPPTKSKEQAIKQMADAENYLNLFIGRAKAFAENPDLVTPDFVKFMNGEGAAQEFNLASVIDYGQSLAMGGSPTERTDQMEDAPDPYKRIFGIDSEIKKVEIQPDEFDGLDELL